MSDARSTKFRPRWTNTLTPEAEALLADTPSIGSRPWELPRLDTRIFTPDHRARISLRSVGEVSQLTQKLADYAGYDEFYGPNPNFADLRSLASEITQFTKLTCEPFEEGSFTIPAHFESDSIKTVLDDGRERCVDTDAIAKRFSTILESISNDRAVSDISVGALQTLSALKGVLGRENATVEYSTSDRTGECIYRCEINDSFLHRVSALVKGRRSSREKLETIEGRVTALDIVECNLLLTVEGVRHRVKGDFSAMFTPSLRESLNQRVRLDGVVESRGNDPHVIHIQSVELLDAE